MKNLLDALKPGPVGIDTALSMTCPVFVTNDRRLPEIEGIQIVQLDILR